MSEATKVLHVAEDQALGPDESLQRVADRMSAKGSNIRMRINIQLWDGEQYVSWRGQVWKLEVADTDEAHILQQGLERFFDLVAANQIDKVPLVEGDEEQIDGSRSAD